MGFRQEIHSLATKVAQYVKDVFTGKAFSQNFFNDGRQFDEWFAHGANEAANYLLHGQPAQVYNRSLSPMQQSTVMEVDQPEVGIHGAMHCEAYEFGDTLSSIMDQVPDIPEQQMEQEMSQ